MAKTLRKIVKAIIEMQVYRATKKLQRYKNNGGYWV
jgi:hypothetical protein